MQRRAIILRYNRLWGDSAAMHRLCLHGNASIKRLLSTALFIRGGNEYISVYGKHTSTVVLFQ